MELILSIFGIFLLLIFCCIFIGAAVYAGCSLMAYLEERDTWNRSDHC